MPTLDEIRQTANLAFVASGKEFSFGNAADCPLPPAELAALNAKSAAVEAVITGGLTAQVFKLNINGQRYAVKQARAECLVQNPDGETSFLNELHRHAELSALRLASPPHTVPGIISPLYGSLKHGVVVSPWIDGHAVEEFNARQITQLFETGAALIANGFFEWDFSSGNLLDDGKQVWLFDFGYMYRFHPLIELNSAGHGSDQLTFHLAERIEARSYFAKLLELEGREGRGASLAHFKQFKQIALETYQKLQQTLSLRGANANVLAWYENMIIEWTDALDGKHANIETLFLREAWRAHTGDLEDDLRGKTCTARTLLRAQWLISAATNNHAALQKIGALLGDDQTKSSSELAAQYVEKLALARLHLVKPA